MGNGECGMEVSAIFLSAWLDYMLLSIGAF
jgi:hypothetical protein